MILIGKNLVKKYGASGPNVLDNISIEIDQAESIALLGPSGTGKSTLLHVLSGIESVDSGDVILCGKDLSQTSDSDLLQLRKENTGTVFQFFHLLPTLTAFENIQISLQLLGHSAQECKNRTKEILDYMGLASRANAYPQEMSGGELQRVAIARSIIHQPKIIFADEPTGNLDEDTGNAVLDYLFKVCKDFDIALFMVTHSRVVAAMCQRVFRLEHGKLNAHIS